MDILIPSEDELKALEIIWHPTTPKKFECMPGCCCCAKPFFFPSEFEKLPNKIRMNIIEREYPFAGFKIIAPKPLFKDDENSCCFFDRNSAYHCSIFHHRPLKCQIYPFIPFITNEKITIFAEPFIDYWKRVADFEYEEGETEWLTNCYGLGREKNVKEEIEELALKYLIKLREIPLLFLEHIKIDIESHLRWNKIKKQEILIKKFDEDSVRKMFGFE